MTRSSSMPISLPAVLSSDSSCRRKPLRGNKRSSCAQTHGTSTNTRCQQPGPHQTQTQPPPPTPSASPPTDLHAVGNEVCVDAVREGRDQRRQRLGHDSVLSQLHAKRRFHCVQGQLVPARGTLHQRV